MTSRPGRDEVMDRSASGFGDQARVPPKGQICVVGLGYVGLPLAVTFDQAGYDVVGYDVDDAVVDSLEDGEDVTGELGDEAVRDCNVRFTSGAEAIAGAQYVVLAVPTPIEDGQPSMAYVEAAAETVGEWLSPSTTVVLESTVYPGATREILVPTLESTSGLVCGEDFFVGYSPERANPGDNERGMADVVKIVSGQTDAVLEEVEALYDRAIDAGVHRAPSMEVAEAAKLVENVQRDVNIAVVNELAMAFDSLDIDTQAVLEAAGTKWNFHDYDPGLVSGHCIPVDPYFLIERAKQAGYTPDLLETSRRTNEALPEHVANLVLRTLNETDRAPNSSRVLILGVSYKPNVGDVRSSKVGVVIDRLEAWGVDVVASDPHVDDDRIRETFDVEPQSSFGGIDAVLLSTPHEEFRNLPIDALRIEAGADVGLVDVRGVLDPEQVPDDVIYRRV